MTTYWRSKGKEETLGKQHLMFYVSCNVGASEVFIVGLNHFNYVAFFV